MFFTRNKTEPAVPYFGVDAPMPKVKEPVGPPPNMKSGGTKPLTVLDIRIDKGGCNETSQIIERPDAPMPMYKGSSAGKSTSINPGSTTEQFVSTNRSPDVIKTGGGGEPGGIGGIPPGSPPPPLVPPLDYGKQNMTEVKPVKMGDVGLGLPDNVSTFLTSSDFRINWETRNRFIFATLTFIGLLVALITCAILYNALFQKDAIDDKTLSLIRTMLWTFTTAFMTIIGAMFFGKQFDVANFRKAASDVIQAAVKKPTT